jgi:hypothetical protein
MVLPLLTRLAEPDVTQVEGALGPEPHVPVEHGIGNSTADANGDMAVLLTPTHNKPLRKRRMERWNIKRITNAR